MHRFYPHPKSLSPRRGILNLAPFSLGRRAGDEGSQESHSSNRIAIVTIVILAKKRDDYNFFGACFFGVYYRLHISFLFL
jgi:hypothetical protein